MKRNLHSTRLYTRPSNKERNADVEFKWKRLPFDEAELAQMIAVV